MFDVKHKHLPRHPRQGCWKAYVNRYGVAFKRAVDGLTVLSSVDVHPDDGPFYHLSISVFPGTRRANRQEVREVLRDFGAHGFDEDSHWPGMARHFWQPVGGKPKAQAPKPQEPTVQLDGYTWRPA